MFHDLLNLTAVGSLYKIPAKLHIYQALTEISAKEIPGCADFLKKGLRGHKSV
jgi:hypothetical protein